MPAVSGNLYVRNSVGLNDRPSTHWLSTNMLFAEGGTPFSPRDMWAVSKSTPNAPTN